MIQAFGTPFRGSPARRAGVAGSRSRASLAGFLLAFCFSLTAPATGFAQLSATDEMPESHADFRPGRSGEFVPALVDSVIQYGKKFIGKPYRYRTRDANVLDCSGFIQYIADKYDIELPRTSIGQRAVAQKIQYSDIRKGDLLFFKSRDRRRNTVGHVSMVVDVEGDQVKMMHSCSRGILIDEYPMSYYKERFLSAGRIEWPEIPAVDTVAIMTMDTMSMTRPPVEPVMPIEMVRILGVGDMMLGTNYPSSAHLPPNDGKDLLAPVTHIISTADIAFGNLEGVLLSASAPSKKCSDPSKCYSFKSPDHYAGYFKKAGFDVLSMANNHVGDFGDTGRKNSMQLLQEQGIEFAGLEDHPYATFTRDGVRYGFCAFAPNSGTVKIHDYARLKTIVHHLDSLSDIVIVSFHGGAEGATHNRITRKTEYYLGENRGNPYEFARIAIDAGADVVFGHGPHVPRAVDLYKDRFIAYSLGNFATYGRFSLSGVSGLAPILEVRTDKQGKFLSGQIHSAIQLGEGGPVIDASHKAAKEIKRLTELDVPEAPIRISETGEITRKSA